MTQPGKHTAGVLQISVAATKPGAPAKKAPKPPAPRLKLLIRRLPPGLTQTELEGALGQDWTVGGGKVDWLQYKPGKVSKEYGSRRQLTRIEAHSRCSPAKPSRPSRAYIHVTSNEHIAPLADRVRQTSFQDARNTTHDPVLLGPPTLEFSPYAKTPGTRMRKDARQGTIDQDPEFIAFLESLTQPLTKPTPVDSAENDEKKQTVTTTPLVQFIKDKKASKAKDVPSSKSSKRAEKESKQEKVQAKKLLQRSDKELVTNSSSDRRTKGDKPSKESGKAAKQAAAITKTGKSSTSNATKEASTSATERKRERGTATAATKILQRDLGLSPSPSGGRRRGKGGSTESGSPKPEGSRDSSAPTAAERSKKEAASKPPKGTPSTPSSNKAKDGEAKASDAVTTGTTSAPPARPPKAAKPNAAVPAKPAPGSTQAFLKHANPSQGVTEALLTAAFLPFGAVTKVEIDKKKGFGYVDFVESESLQRAMLASPVAVAQSQVVVLERKANPGGEKTRKARADSQQAKDGKAKTGEGNVAAATGSSRGSRGGRGGRNKGKGEGSKGGAEKTGGSEAK